MGEQSLQNLPSDPHDSPIYRWRIALDHVTNLCILSFLIHSCSLSLLRFNVYPNTEAFCTWIIRCNVSIYHITRCTLYGILLIRIHIGFNNSIYSYSIKYIIRPLFMIIIFWFIITMFFDILYESVVYGQYNNYYESCSPIFDEWAVLTSGSFDIAISTILLILFIRPLLKLNRNIKMHQIREEVGSQQRCMDTFNTINTKTMSYPVQMNKSYKVSMDINVSPINLNAATIVMHDGDNQSGTGTSNNTPYNTPNSVISASLDDINNNNDGVLVIVHDIDEEKEIDIDKLPEWNINGLSNQSTITVESIQNDTDPDIADMDIVDFANKGENPSNGSVLNREQHRLNNNIYDELITRYALLVILCIGSSFLLYFGVYFFGHWVAELAPIDDAINVWCIILISNKNNKVYHKLCYSCNYCMKLCCIFRMNVGLESKVTEIVNDGRIRSKSVTSTNGK